MSRIKKTLRVMLLAFLLLLALAGVGIPLPKHLYEKKEDTIELVENEEESDKD